MAIEAGNVEILELLLENGADPNWLRQDYYKSDYPLAWAADKADVGMVKLLLKYKADPNGPADSGTKPLHFAGHSAEITGMLLEAGADVNIRDAYGNTPLHTAACPQVIKLLLDHGADPELKNDSGKRPIDQPEVKQILDDRGK